MKIRLYQPCNDGTYHAIPDNMLVSNPEYFYPAADYEELEAKLAALEKLETAAHRLVDHAKNSKQEDWASLPDVLALEAALPPISASSDKWCLYQDQCRHSGSVNRADSECNSCITHCNFEWKEE